MSLWQSEIEWMDSAAAIDVVASDFVVVTADAADVPAYERLRALLVRVRNAFGIEAAFVSEWACGAPVLRASGSEACALHALYGARLLDKPRARGSEFRIETVPVVSDAGLELGTLCSRRESGKGDGKGDDEHAVAGALWAVARLIAGWFDEAEQQAASAAAIA
jgi:hypothetical protein